MRPRNTLLLLAVALLLGAAVWWSSRHEAEKVEAEAQAKRLFGALDAGEVEWIALATSDGRDARLARVDGAWRVVEPVAFPADATNADALASALAALASESAIDEPQDASVYGLGEGARVVRFLAGGQEHELRIGKKTPVGANDYASVGGDPRVYTVATFQTTSFERPLDDLRERRPLRFEREDVARIEVAWEGGDAVLERGDGVWRLVSPIEAPADPDTVETLLSDLGFLRAAGFVDEPPPDAETGLDRPAWRVALVGVAAEEGEPAPRYELAIGGVLEEGARAGRGAERALYRIPADRYEKLPRRLVDFREKQLARFDANEAQRFELVFADASGAASQAVTVTGLREGDGWKTEPEAMGPGRAARLVAELARLKGVDIAAEEMGPQELAGVGLAPPRAAIRVFGKPTAEGGDAPLLADVQLGVEQKGRVLARTPLRSQVYLIDAALADGVPVSLEAFRSRFVAQEPPAEGDAPSEAVAPPPDFEEPPTGDPGDAEPAP